ncbi:DUF5707 domain-containing protein [Streptomyces werraensis]|uniref:DUF5707 domain-containing protein n=1 Tax=Streptomyces werraensis TaxID=68284 RepID=UPI00307DE70B
MTASVSGTPAPPNTSSGHLLRPAESATCEPSGHDTARCTYTVPVTATDADASPGGLWHVAVLATADDGSSTLDPEAADFTVQ